MKEVTMYMSDDGMKFDTVEECQAHDLALYESDQSERFDYTSWEPNDHGGFVLPTTHLTRFLTDNKELLLELLGEQK